MHDPKRSDIPVGEKNAVNRQTLSSLWGKSDRAVRKQIEEFRMDTLASDVIIAHSDGRGYWRSSDIAEIEGYRAEQVSYKDAFEARIAILDKVLMNLREEASQSELPF